MLTPDPDSPPPTAPPAAPAAPAAPADAAPPAARVLDIRGEVCPYTFVKTKLALEDLALGEVLEVIGDNPEGAVNVPRSCVAHGHEVLACAPAGEREWRLRVRKAREE